MKEIIDIIHKSIYPFFDVCKEGEEPLSDKDKLLLKVNKAICNNLKALEKEPNGDAVSHDVFEQVRWERDVAIEQLKELGYVLGQKIEPCSDAISRQAVKEQMIKYGFHAPDMTVTEFIEDLPSVNPQEPKTGHWIPLGNYDDYGNESSYKCSKCGDIDTYLDNYCPNCGARMESER